MKLRAFLFVLVILVLLISGVSAQATLSFRDMSLAGYQNFRIYEVNGTGTYDRGLYNSSTDALNLAPDGNLSYAYVLQFVPSSTDYIAHPLLVVGSFFDYTNTHYPDILVLVFVVACVALVVYLARRK
jgi:hypothetical protein